MLHLDRLLGAVLSVAKVEMGVDRCCFYKYSGSDLIYAWDAASRRDVVGEDVHGTFLVVFANVLDKEGGFAGVGDEKAVAGASNIVDETRKLLRALGFAQ